MYRSDVLGVLATQDIDGDLGSPIDHVSARNITPLVVGVLVEGLEYTNILSSLWRGRWPLKICVQRVSKAVLKIKKN